MRALIISQLIPLRESRSLPKYLNEISKVELLSAEDEAELAQRIRKGDVDAIHTLVKANLRFVVAVAKQFRSPNLPLSDLINEGNLGLIRAAEKFDETKGFKFISYAVWWIRQAILKAIADHSRLVRLPLNKNLVLNQINKTYSDFEQQYEREPTINDLSEKINMNVAEIGATVNADAKHLSFSVPVSEEYGDDVLLDIAEETCSARADNNVVYKDSLKIDMERILSSLTAKQREIIKLHFGMEAGYEMTLENIGEKLGLSTTRIGQIKTVAIRKLQSKKSMMADYL